MDSEEASNEEQAKEEEISNAVRVHRGKGSVLCGRDALFELEEKR